MATLLDDLVEQSRRLPANERIALGLLLLDEESTDRDAKAGAAWEVEIQSRIRAVDAGRARGIPLAQALDEVDRRLAE